MQTILDAYITDAPSAQSAVDLFKGEWSSQLPEEIGANSGGQAALFSDARIAWFLDRLGDLTGRSAIELGPLEAAHTCMLECAGLASILAIESNTRAYLKCLIVKELMGLQRSRFLLGDFIEHLKLDDRHYDIGIASGVIYHMRNPAELIELLSRRCDDMLVWTHYWDPDRLADLPEQQRLFDKPQPAEHSGFKHHLVRRDYKEALGWGGFCGGSSDFANWMPRDELLACFEHFGFDVQAIEFDHPNHPNGPALSLHARRRNTRPTAT